MIVQERWKFSGKRYKLYKLKCIDIDVRTSSRRLLNKQGVEE